MSRPDLPAVDGIVTGADVAATAASIAAVQEPWGAIPWFPGHTADAWNHVEAAMALTVGGLNDAAVRAYEWLRRSQRADGSWPTLWREGRVEDPIADTNQCAYVAVGVWHHWLLRRDESFVVRMWPTVRRALDYVVGLQTDRGEFPWKREPDGTLGEFALLTGCSSTYQSLRAGLALAAFLDEPQPEWEMAAGRVAHVVAEHPEAFADKSTFSMDWYYPVLGGSVRGDAGFARLASRWDEFIVPGLGCRCVHDQPWVTGAETCELVMALDALGDGDRAREMFAMMQHLRDADGAYWTGYQYANRVNWPADRSTYTAAAVVLAADVLSRTTPGATLFLADDLPSGVDLARGACGCPSDLEWAYEPWESAAVGGDPLEHS